MTYATCTRNPPVTPLYAQEMTPAAILPSLIERYPPIGLHEMDAVALLNRIDTKFVFSTQQLVDVLGRLRFDYRILAINERRIHRYRTLYFDTRGYDLYHAHVTGRAHVYKVREREYSDTRISYLEVKHKDHKRRTEKSRLPVARCSGGLDEEMQDFVSGFLALAGVPLEAKLWNTFGRITLVSNAALERVTIDLDLAFDDGRQTLTLDGIAIAEVKQDQFTRSSVFLEEIHRLGLRNTGFSKYCYGVARLAAGVKRNTQKAKARMIEKYQSGGSQHGLVT